MESNANQYQIATSYNHVGMRVTIINTMIQEPFSLTWLLTPTPAKYKERPIQKKSNVSKTQLKFCGQKEVQLLGADLRYDCPVKQ